MARAVKSEEELAEVRDAMEIIVDGFWALVAAYRAGQDRSRDHGPAVRIFFARGAGPRMMNILLSGENGEAEAYFKVPGHPRGCGGRLAPLFARNHWRGRLLGGIFPAID